MIKTTSRDSPLPGIEYLKISGGIFHDCAVHDIDLVTWILSLFTIVFTKSLKKRAECIAITTFKARLLGYFMHNSRRFFAW